jgi:hypothetical protein
MVRTDSGTSYRLSKSDKPPCPAERQQQLGEYTDRPRTCQPWFLRFPQLSSGALRTPLKEIRCGGFASDSNFQFERFRCSSFDAPLFPILRQAATARPSCRGCALAHPGPSEARTPGRLLGSSEEPQDNPRGHPVIVLMYVSPKGSPVVVGIEQTDFKAAGRLDI